MKDVIKMVNEIADRAIEMIEERETTIQMLEEHNELTSQKLNNIKDDLKIKDDIINQKSIKIEQFKHLQVDLVKIKDAEVQNVQVNLEKTNNQMFKRDTEIRHKI